MMLVLLKSGVLNVLVLVTFAAEIVGGLLGLLLLALLLGATA